MRYRIHLAVFLMGFTSLAVQTILIREFLITFNGNELTVGIVLANWILLVALGSWLGGRRAEKATHPEAAYSMLQAGIALYLPVALGLIRIAKNLMGSGVGEGVGIGSILSSTFLIPSILGLFIGAQFPFGCRLMRAAAGRPEESAGRVYLIESLGFIAAGILLTFYLITRYNSFFIVILAAFTNALSALSLLKNDVPRFSRRVLYAAVALLAILLGLSLFGPADSFHRRSLIRQWRGLELVDDINSPYGNLAVTKNAGQYTFYSDGVPVITAPTPDIASIEDLVHFTMLSRLKPQRVLIIGGGTGGVIGEVLKYDIEKLTYCELDGAIIRLVKEFPTELTKAELADPRLEIRYMDGRRFLSLAERSGLQFDTVIVNLPMPSTLQLNRFYTKEFFEGVREILARDGIISFKLPGSLSYLSPELRRLNGTVLRALESSLDASVIPGYSNIYLASRARPVMDPERLMRRLEEERIKSRTFTLPYLRNRLDPAMAKWFYDSMRGYRYMRTNTDFLPIAVYDAILYWNAAFSPAVVGPILAVLEKITFVRALLFVVFIGIALFALMGFVRSPRRYAAGFAIFSTGFTGMSLNLLLIYAYQSVRGYLFGHIALLMAVFMGALAFGSWQCTRLLKRLKDDRKAFLRLESLMMGFAFAAGGALLARGWLMSVFFLLSATAGLFVGAEFPLANKIYARGKDGGAGTLYALDLIGGWVGALIVSAALVPLIGMAQTCAIAGALKAISLIVSARGIRDT